MADNTSTNKKKIISYDIHAGYVDASQICDPATTEFEEFIIGAGNPPTRIVDVSCIPEEEIPWLHDNTVISAKIDPESTAAQISDDYYWPDMKVTAVDLSTGMYSKNTNLR